MQSASGATFDQSPSRAPSREIEALDPDADFQRIVYLLSYQLFPWDIERSLEFALLDTYAIPSISGLLTRTGEFTQRARKRYDDTELLLAEVGEHGFESPRGTEALGRINAMHGRFRIPNEDYLFVLSTFVLNPIDWMAQYGRRPFTGREQQAWLLFYQKLGNAMGIADIPPDLEGFRTLRERVERERMVLADSNRTVSSVTIDLVLAMYVPSFMFRLVRPVAMSLCSDRLVDSIGAPRPPCLLRAAVRGAMRLRGWLLARLPENRKLKRITKRANPTYPRGYEIAGLGVLRPND